jgi:hypothetical protein
LVEEQTADTRRENRHLQSFAATGGTVPSCCPEKREEQQAAGADSMSKPTHTAYTVRDFTKKDTGEVDASWLKIGVAFAHKDGKGFDVALDAVPVNGRVVLRLNPAEKKK